MQDQLALDKTVVVSTFLSRMEAEVAREYLADMNVEAFVSADDAGGMHPQLQQVHGVKLMVLDSQAESAYALLQEANLLTEPDGQFTEEEMISGGWRSKLDMILLVAFLLVMLIISFIITLA
ncbi:MAG: hypothetical protein AAF564_01080 [Bacteroidota bacterium]